MVKLLQGHAHSASELIMLCVNVPWPLCRVTGLPQSHQLQTGTQLVRSPTAHEEVCRQVCRCFNRSACSSPTCKFEHICAAWQQSSHGSPECRKVSGKGATQDPPPLLAQPPRPNMYTIGSDSSRKFMSLETRVDPSLFQWCPDKKHLTLRQFFFYGRA